jgi:uncharacterized protein (TIGR02246 family)
MDAAVKTRTDEDEIRDLVARWTKGAKTQDLEGVMALYTPDVVAFDAIMALQFKGRDAYRKHWETCFSYMPSHSEMIWDMQDLQVTVDQNLAYYHYVVRCGCVIDGVEKSGWMRGTGCCRKTKGKWLIAHEHTSSPFDPMSNQVINEAP